MNARRLLCLIVPPLLSVACVRANDIPLDQPALSLDGSTGAWSLDWWGVDARTYFIQHTEELAKPTPWSFLPVIEQGADAPLSYGFWLSPMPPRFFLRLQGSDQPHDGDPYAADFDGDGLPNGWEIEAGLNPFAPTDAAGLAPGAGGLSWLEFFQQSLGDGADPLQANALGLAIYSP